MKAKQDNDSIELIPSLDACVETQAKRLYNKILSQLLEKGENRELEHKLELLTLFLETADFNKLRSESERHLIESKTVIFTITRDDNSAKHDMKVC